MQRIPPNRSPSPFRKPIKHHLILVAMSPGQRAGEALHASAE